ncbi:DUF6493 family protein [Actinocorallia sp. B10E7]|uniref:DUF6493 family protein n=1 Tax=Actinocorallia sp. B10E7 TaxID=3153558 RepID=UPI00325D024A
MSVWEGLSERITAGDVPAVLGLLEPLDDAERKEVARELPVYVRSRGDRSRSDFHDGQSVALKAAGAACLPAAAAASWLVRRDLRVWRSEHRAERAVLQASSHRPASWRADVGRRLAGKLRLRDMDPWDGEGELNWEIAAQLLASAGEVPTDDAFVVGWLIWRRTAPREQDPFFPALVPFVFEAEGAGARLADERPEENGTWSRTGSWIGKLLAAAATDAADMTNTAGAADGARTAAKSPVCREALLDGCIRRFLRGGRARDLAWFIRLHHALAPTVEEDAARLRDYVRLLPSAPPAVAELAFGRVKAVDGRTPLPGDLFTETVEALLFRPEAKLVKAALVWLDRTARARGGEAAAVGFAATLFGHERPELRERAVKLAVKYAGKADPLTAEAVRAAAAVLPGTLLPLVTGAFGAVEAAEPEAPPVLYAPVPTDLPGPISSPAELFEETVLHLRNHDMGWAETERLTAGLVTMGPAIVEELQQHVHADAPYLLHKSYVSHLFGPSLLVHILLEQHAGFLRRMRRARKKAERQGSDSSVSPRPPRRRFIDAAARLDHRLRVFSQHQQRGKDFPAPARLLHLRFVDAAAHLGAPVLLATPTSSTGHVDPDVFAARLRLLEEAGEEPGTYDLEQALLRLPVGTVRIPGLDRLSSPAAGQARDWLARGGFHAPDLAYGFVGVKSRQYPWGPGPTWVEVPRFHAGSSCDSPLRSARLLGTITPPPEENTRTGYHSPQIPWWPSLLPSHRELVAAHLLDHTASSTHDSYDHGLVLPALADTTGPTGPATAAVLLHGLGSEKASGRAGAVDALLSFAAQDALPAADLGRLLPRLLEADAFPLTRLLPPLTDAVRAGAPLWPLFAEAIPALLPEPGTPARTGLAPFLSLAATTAELHRVRAPLPALAAWTPSSRSSRPAKEAVRLLQTLTSP